jgi:hypothetical protein
MHQLFKDFGMCGNGYFETEEGEKYGVLNRSIHAYWNNGDRQS